MSLAGRLVRTKYFPDGFATAGTAITIAKSKVDSCNLSAEGIDSKTKDDAAWATFVDDVARKGMTLTVSGLLAVSHQTFVQMWADMDTDETLFDFEQDFPTIGKFQAKFMMTGIELGGEDNAEATFSATFQSSGAVTFTAAS